MSKEPGKLNMLPVRYFSAEERELFLDTAERCGFPVEEERKIPYRERGVHLYFVHLKNRVIEPIYQVMIGACMASGGSRFYHVDEFCRLAELDFSAEPRYPVFHIPHDGYDRPAELMRSVCISEDDFDYYDAVMSDVGISGFIPRAHYTGSNVVRFDVCRILCDVERFIGPQEVMEQYGMGFCYERAYDGTKIKHVTDELRKKTLVYYNEHHARMDRLCDRHERILLFDLHSYHDEIVPAAFLQPGRKTPDLCIGADDRFTPPALMEILRRRFEEAGFSVAVNDPYSGTFVPNAVLSGASECDLVSVMLEFHKRTYCDEYFSPIEEKQNAIRAVLQKVLADCAAL